MTDAPVPTPVGDDPLRPGAPRRGGGARGTPFPAAPRLAMAALLALWAGGCGPSRPAASSPPRGTPVAPITNTDACATRLHELSGPLLFYYATRHQLPASLDEIRQTPVFEGEQSLVCPVSNLPYVYDPAGFPAPGGQGGKVILHDPAPSHSGMRWGVSIIEPADEGPLVTKVIALPESLFNKTPGRR